MAGSPVQPCTQTIFLELKRKPWYSYAVDRDDGHFVYIHFCFHLQKKWFKAIVVWCLCPRNNVIADVITTQDLRNEVVVLTDKNDE